MICQVLDSIPRAQHTLYGINIDIYLYAWVENAVWVKNLFDLLEYLVYFWAV